MAWHRHREKRMKQNKKNKARNTAAKRTLRILTKQLLALIKEKKTEEAKTLFKKLAKTYSTAAKRGIVHKKNASRHISRLAAKVSSLTKSNKV